MKKKELMKQNEELLEIQNAYLGLIDDLNNIDVDMYDYPSEVREIIENYEDKYKFEYDSKERCYKRIK